MYTGRLPSFPEDIIEIPLPTDEDFFPDTARSNVPDAKYEPVEPVPFNYLVRLMVICGRIATVLNGQRGRPRTLARQTIAPSALCHLQKELVQFYADLPESLKWGHETFKHQEARGHGVSRVSCLFENMWDMGAEGEDGLPRISGAIHIYTKDGPTRIYVGHVFPLFLLPYFLCRRQAGAMQTPTSKLAMEFTQPVPRQIMKGVLRAPIVPHPLTPDRSDEIVC